MKRLIEYLPGSLQNIREYKGIFGAVEEELKILSADIVEYSHCRSIDEANEYAIERMGKILGIVFPGGMKAEDKRFEVKTRIMDYRPFNEVNIRAVLARLCGTDGYRLYIDEGRTAVTVKLGLSSQDLEQITLNMLEGIIPENMMLIVSSLNTYGVLEGKTYGQLEAYTYEELRTEVIE